MCVVLIITFTTNNILFYRLVTHLVMMGFIADVHFAYLSGKSTYDCIERIVQHIQKGIKIQQHSPCIFYDFSAAFDCVRCNVLLWKLCHEFLLSGFTLHSRRLN